MGRSECVDIGFTVDVDDVDFAPSAAVHVLKVVDDAEHVHSVGNVVAAAEELDLPVDVVLDESVDSRRPLDVFGKVFQRGLEMRFENAETVLDTGRLIEPSVRSS